jgi:HEAT repeat protein
VANTLGKMTKRFQDAMRMMRAADPQRKEDGFQLLHEHVTEHTDELIAEFEQEQNDHGLRCWLLELIGETKSESAFPLLAAQLHSPDEAFRRWAVTGLENLGTKSARQALYQARSNGEIPDHSDDS